MDKRKKLYYILASMFLVVMIGSTGYYLLFDGTANFLDCLYMTVVSISTVGYGEILQISGNTSAEIFTMFLITFGIILLSAAEVRPAAACLMNSLKTTKMLF
jgi:voltage-gated potassium channel